MQSGKNPPISACEHLISELNLTEQPTRLFAQKPAYSRKLLQLKRAKEACKLGMVVDPRSTKETGVLFLSRRQYEELLNKDDTQSQKFKA